VPILVRIPGPLRELAGGSASVRIDGEIGTVGEALEALFRRHPGLRDRVTTDQGAVRQHVNVFVGVASIRYTGGLETPLPAGAEVSIVPAVSGGCAGA
jgi:MoaD family protein